MKRLFMKFISVAAVASAVVLTGCMKEYREGTTMKIDDSSDREVTVGDTVFLRAIISPADESSSVVWATTDENVAKVVVQRLVEGMADRYVMVLANAPGEAKVYVTVNGTMSDTCKIKVNGTPTDPAKVTLSDSLLVIEKGYSDTLAYTLEPEGAEASSVVWSVRDGKIAAVSQDGVVVALDDGMTWVYVKIDDKITDSCQICAGIVYPEAPDSACIKVAGIWWAPVNCGYDAKDYPYGKLYQWGRKDGCGYKGVTSSAIDDKGDILQTTSTTDAPVSVANENRTIFYKINRSSYPNLDWLTPQDSTRWNSNKVWPGKETSPKKTDYDPCPTGWRVPTYTELNVLTGNSQMIQSSDGWDDSNKGYWFNGTESPKSGEGLFLPAAGYRNCLAGNAMQRGSYGDYCSSSVRGVFTRYLVFHKEEVEISNFGARAQGLSVRCVKE